MFRKYFSLLKNTEKALSFKEWRKLKSMPRYTPVETKLYGVVIKSNDSCTLLGDIDGILNKGVYQFMSESSRPVIVDCGANIGMSIVYFKRLYPGAKIIAFEPDPNLFDILSCNIDSFMFNDIELVQKALWVHNDGVLFDVEGGHSGAIHMQGQNDNNTVKVQSIRLKDVLCEYEKIDMLKIDIEGAENEVIFDCDNELSRCDHIFIEYHSRNGSEQRLHEILYLLNKLNYRYHIHEAFTRYQPFVDRNCMVGMDLQLNLFFYK
ncbi:FkbM family methyltransferase [Desulfopila sp. IMCC35008]|uniref:FkbM family methyltransferase n=1 Tax=Desulfopila sp. IMCC35008 TaxID=2653858 RepID=UPI0013D2A518|nr:FkbM family methyltransferase [Desulfopila sp. IMCC35008]